LLELFKTENKALYKKHTSNDLLNMENNSVSIDIDGIETSMLSVNERSDNIDDMKTDDMKTNLFKTNRQNGNNNIFNHINNNNIYGSKLYVEYVLNKLGYNSDVNEFNDAQNAQNANIWKVISTRRVLEKIMRDRYNEFIDIEKFNEYLETYKFKIPFIYMIDLTKQHIDLTKQHIDLTKQHIRIAVFQYNVIIKKFKLIKIYKPTNNNTDNHYCYENLNNDKWKDDTNNNIFQPKCLIYNEYLYIIKDNMLDCIPNFKYDGHIERYIIYDFKLFNSSIDELIKKNSVYNSNWCHKDLENLKYKLDVNCTIDIVDKTHDKRNNIITVKHFYDDESLNKTSNEINKLILLSLLLPILLGVVVDASGTIIIFMENYYANEFMEIFIITFLNFILLDKFIVKVYKIIKNIKSLLSSCGLQDNKIDKDNKSNFFIYMTQTLWYTMVFQYYNLVIKIKCDKYCVLTIVPQVFTLIINWTVLILLFISISIIYLSVVVVKLMLLFIKNVLTFLMYLDRDYLDNFDILFKKSMSVNYLETHLYDSLDTNKQTPSSSQKNNFYCRTGLSGVR
jgi:hypothetical protein